jgi:hypothetical protein
MKEKEKCERERVEAYNWPNYIEVKIYITILHKSLFIERQWVVSKKP